ncbi:MAG: hypothetical protein IJB74_06915 [Clostridia bacterium]|nr:hypothetical protein [Clostridia bacterium]
MVCKECEKTIAKNSNYCKYCGAKVEKAEKEEKKVSVINTKKTAKDDTSLLFKEVEVTESEAETGAERILDFDGAVEPLHIVFPKLFCTGQLFMVKKYKFLNEQGKKYKKNILIRVNIA